MSLFLYPVEKVITSLDLSHWYVFTYKAILDVIPAVATYLLTNKYETYNLRLHQ